MYRKLILTLGALALPLAASAAPWTQPVQVVYVQAQNNGIVHIRTTHNNSVSGQTSQLNFDCSDPDLRDRCVALATTALTTQRELVIDYQAQSHNGITCSYTTAGRCLIKNIRLQ